MPDIDIIPTVQNYLKANKSTLKFKSNRPIKHFERVADYRAFSTQYGFPAIGILDGGHNTFRDGASVKLKTEFVIIAIYVEVLGDPEKCIDETRAIHDKAIFQIREKENYFTGAVFDGYSRAFNPKSGETKLIFTDQDRPVIVKLARVEFTKKEVQN